MIQYSSKYRSKQTEILDNFDLNGPEMEIMLKDLNIVNTILGGKQVTIQGIEMLLHHIPKSEQITIVDLGCGDGEILRNIAQFGKKRGYLFTLIGLDANKHIIQTAIKKSEHFPNIQFKVGNIFSVSSMLPSYHIALCTLLLHHFKNEEIKRIVETLTSEASIGVVVNDLHRSRIAFWMFRFFSSIFIKSKIARHDGLVSVARGFKHSEIQDFAGQISKATSIIQWKWAFRWQWILKCS